MLQCFDEEDDHPQCNKQISNIHGKIRHLIKTHQNTRKEMWHKDSHKQKIGKNLINIRHKKKNNKIEKISHKHKKK